MNCRLACGIGQVLEDGGGALMQRGCLDEIFGFIAGGEERFDLVAQRGIAGASLVQIGGALIWVDLGRDLEYGFDALPAVGCHVGCRMSDFGCWKFLSEIRHASFL